MIAIIDYGMGNLGSIRNMLQRLGTHSIVTSDRVEIKKADKIILPGIGSFDHAMKNLKDLDLVRVLNEKAQELKTPILGICLGMQIMTKDSQEGSLSGLGWIDAHAKKFSSAVEVTGLKIPHMGWNTLEIRKNVSLLADMSPDSRFYFIHSYYVVCNNNEDIVSTTNHGYSFVSIFKKDNIMGVQFHPEKSHKFGMQILQNFTQIAC